MIPKPPRFLGKAIFLPTYQVNTFIVTISPNKITGGLIYVVTNVEGAKQSAYSKMEWWRE